ncbi:MAG: TlpA family protein disulfide reductase [Streptomycetales bacterium]
MRRIRTIALALALPLAGLLAGCGGDPAGQVSRPAVVRSPGGGGDGGQASEISALLTRAGLPRCPQSSPQSSPQSGGGATAADGLPSTSLPCLGSGPDVTLSGLRGKPLVVNVWASWCPPCAQEMPRLAQVHERAGGRLRFLGVDILDRRADGLAAAPEFGMSFPSVHDPDGLIRSTLKVPGPPVTFFVTPEGKIAHTHYGELESVQQITGLVERHLGMRL